MSDRNLSPELRAWKRRMMLSGLATSVLGFAGLLLGGINAGISTGKPALRWVLVGTLAVIMIAVGSLMCKFAAVGPFPRELTQ